MEWKVLLNKWIPQLMKRKEMTRLTRFVPGADSFLFGPKGQDSPEEAMITQGGFYDAAFRV